MSNILKLNINDVVGAIVSAMLVAVVGYLTTLANITEANWQQILNVAFLAGIGSLLKALGTDNSGVFLGAVKVK